MKKRMIFDSNLFGYVMIKHSDKSTNGTIEIAKDDGSRIVLQKEPNGDTSVFVEGGEKTVKELCDEILPISWEKKNYNIVMDEP